MTHLAIVQVPPRFNSRAKAWPEPQTTISSNPAPNQYFPQGPYGRR